MSRCLRILHVTGLLECHAQVTPNQRGPFEISHPGLPHDVLKTEPQAASPSGAEPKPFQNGHRVSHPVPRLLRAQQAARVARDARTAVQQN